MAFSNTVSRTVFDTRKTLESAIRRCKLPAEQITPEYVEIANNELYLLLSDLANQGVPLWCIERLIVPLYAGRSAVPLPTRIVDVLNSNFRYLSEVSGSNTDTSTARTVAFGSDTFITTVGVLWTGASVPLALERSLDNLVWETIQSETPVEGAGEWSWYDLVSSVATPYFRVRATTGTLGFDQIYLGNNPTEITLSRMNRDDWANLPNRAFQSNRPLQFWYDRSLTEPTMNMWPVPNAAATVCQLTLWCHRYVMDPGTLTQEIEAPQRWQKAIVCMLAAALGREIAEVDAALIPRLDADAAQALMMAQMEERDNSPQYFAPNLHPYTA